MPRAGAIRDTKGIIRKVADAKTDEVLGVTMIGDSVDEVIHEAAMALRFRAKLHDFIITVYTIFLIPPFVGPSGAPNREWH